MFVSTAFCTAVRASVARSLPDFISVLAVLRGHQRPPRYCQNNQSTIAIATTDHGTARGELLKLAVSSDPQIIWPTIKIMNATSAEKRKAESRRVTGLIMFVSGRAHSNRRSARACQERLCISCWLMDALTAAIRPAAGHSIGVSGEKRCPTRRMGEGWGHRGRDMRRRAIT